jgi:hypothetical protein
VASCGEIKLWSGSLTVLACLDGYMNIALEQTEEMYICTAEECEKGCIYQRKQWIVYKHTERDVKLSISNNGTYFS